MTKSYDMEAMADLNIDQIEAMATSTEEGEELLEGEELETKESEQAVEGAAAGVDEEASGVAMKSGKGKPIPYAVLKETREELAEMKARLKTFESKSYQAVIPENHAELVAQAKESLKALASQFEDGSLEWEEYQIKLGELSAQNETLLATRIKSEISSEMQAQSAEQAKEDANAAWFSTVDTFLGSKPDGIDYNADEAKKAELDAAVKMFANNPAYATKDHNWFLAKAHREVMESNGLKPTAKTAPKPAANQEEESPIYSLSDIAGGQLPSGSETEQIVGLSGSALTNRFLNDPSKIDEVLRSFQ